MRGRKAKAIRLALDLSGRVPHELREYVEVPTTRRKKILREMSGAPTAQIETFTERNKPESPRAVYQRVKRRFLA